MQYPAGGGKFQIGINNMLTIKALRWGDKSNRVIHCPSVVGGNAPSLSLALNDLGIASISIAFESHPFGYAPDIVLWKPSDRLLKREVLRIFSVFRVVLGYNVIHFNFGTTMACPSLPLLRSQAGLPLFLIRWLHYQYTELLQIIEVGLLKLLRRHVVITYQGDDARQGDYCLNFFEESIAHHVGIEYYNHITDRIKRRRITRISRIASAITSVNPDLLHMLPSRSLFIPYCHTEVQNQNNNSASAKSGHLRILHAPSHRAAKGSDLIVKTIEGLQSEGHKIELVLLENIPHEFIGKAIDDCDLLIDQLYAGWYGGIGVEALCRAKPVMTYIRESDLKFVDSQMQIELPLISVDAKHLSFEMRNYMSMNEEELSSLQQRSLSFATKWHDRHQIARIYASLYVSD
jgi:hypothetical protein